MDAAVDEASRDLIPDKIAQLGLFIYILSIFISGCFMLVYVFLIYIIYIYIYTPFVFLICPASGPSSLGKIRGTAKSSPSSFPKRHRRLSEGLYLHL